MVAQYTEYILMVRYFVICWWLILICFQVTIRLMMRKGAQLRKEKLAAENENIRWKQYYETLKGEFDKAQEQLTASTV